MIALARASFTWLACQWRSTCTCNYIGTSSDKQTDVYTLLLFYLECKYFFLPADVWNSMTLAHTFI